jgi:hypothetical protein
MHSRTVVRTGSVEKMLQQVLLTLIMLRINAVLVDTFFHLLSWLNTANLI